MVRSKTVAIRTREGGREGERGRSGGRALLSACLPGLRDLALLVVVAFRLSALQASLDKDTSSLGDNGTRATNFADCLLSFLFSLLSFPVVENALSLFGGSTE